MKDSNLRNPGPKPGGIAANRMRDNLGGGYRIRTCELTGSKPVAFGQTWLIPYI